MVLRIFEYSIARAVMEAGGRGAALAAVLAIIFVGSVLTYYGVERPTRRYLRARVPKAFGA